MTKVVENEKKISAEKNDLLEKKSLKEVLSSYLEKNKKEKSIKKIKKDFSELKLNFKETKTSFETLIEIQKKLKLAYNKTDAAKKWRQKNKKK